MSRISNIDYVFQLKVGPSVKKWIYNQCTIAIIIWQIECLHSSASQFSKCESDTAVSQLPAVYNSRTPATLLQIELKQSANVMNGSESVQKFYGAPLIKVFSLLSWKDLANAALVNKVCVQNI